MTYIFGDSFCAHQPGWPSLLSARTYGTRGSSEFRIWKNYQNNRDTITANDTVIFCHTHWSRVYLRDDADNFSSRLLDSHPVCDLLLGDLSAKRDRKYQEIINQLWDEDFLKYNYQKVLDDCRSVTGSLHITFFKDIASEYQLHDFSDIHSEHAGHRLYNHLDTHGNLDVAERINKILENK